jgi:O-antigen/teichoic acid export membrane protein
MTHSVQVQDRQKTIKSGRLIEEAQGYMTLMRDLAKSSGIYALSSLGAPIIALVLAPFLTHSLSTTDYGALVVLNTAILLITGITQLGLISAVFRAYNYDYESRSDRLKVLSTTVVLLSITSIPLTIVFVLVAPWLAGLLLGNTSFSAAIKIAAVVMLIQNFSVPGLAWLRAESRATFFSVVSIVNLLVALGATVVFVGPLHMGISGALLAIGVGYVCIVVCTLPLIIFHAGVSYHTNVVRTLVSFGVPLVFNTLLFWVLQLSDRYLLSRLGSLSQTASYGVAYSLGGALNVVILAPFTLAWPTAMFAIAKREDAAQAFQAVFRWFGLLLLAAAFVLSLIAVALLNILFPVSYHASAPIIPIIAASIVFYGIYSIFTVGTGVKRKKWFIALVMTIAAVINVAANFVLIPHYGSMGAALSTLIAYIILTIIMYFVNQRIYPLPFEVGLFTVALLIGFIFYAGSSLLVRKQTLYGTCVLYVVATVLYCSCLVLLGWLAGKYPGFLRRV